MKSFSSHEERSYVIGRKMAKTRESVFHRLSWFQQDNTTSFASFVCLRNYRHMQSYMCRWYENEAGLPRECGRVMGGRAMKG